MLMLINGLVTIFLLQATHLSSPYFRPDDLTTLWAPGLAGLAAALVLGIILVVGLLYLALKRLILDPLDELIEATHRLSRGETPGLRPMSRTDEVGRLAQAFNSMADEIMEARKGLEDRVREATEEISRTQKELAFAERLAATGRLAAGVAHEINNPLGGVMNALARLRRGGIPEERRQEYFDLCDNGLKRIQDTVRRILDFSRKRPEVREVSVATALRQSLELAGHLVSQAGIRIEDRIDDRTTAAAGHLAVKADAGDLQHVFLNLIVNAVDAMPGGGTLTIGASRSLRWVVVEIVDTGVGMTLDELSASFEYFHTTKPVGKGTGLGLSIAHHIVAAYGGALTLNSRKGEGTKATVELPAADAAMEETSPRPVSGGGASVRISLTD